jgi:uncharacterized damage-inducible protein DinB
MATPLTRFYADWDGCNQRIVKMMAPLTPAQLLLRSAPHMWHVSGQAAHIVGVRAFWIHQIMHEGPPEIAGWLGFDDGPESDRTAERIVLGLNATWDMIAAMLARCTEADLDDTFERVYPERVKTYTRQALIMRVLTHDAQHAGEISQVLGMHGVTGLDW